MLNRTHLSEASRGRTAGLRLFGTSDLHVHLLPYDYFADRPAPHIGLAQTAALVEQLRSEARNSVLLDNGDFLQGTPLSDVIFHEGSFGPGDVHPVIAAMNRVGYDAATLGNHEFNYGLDFLDAALAAAEFPVVCANILRDGPDEDDTYRPPFTILRRRVAMDDGGADVELKIGIIGFAPPQIAGWDRAHLDGQIVTRDIVETATRQVPRMRAAGADLVVALCHSGIGAAHHWPGMENAAVPLAAVPGIDAIVTGHTHGVFPGPDFRATAAVDPASGRLHGVPAVMPGCYGSHLGVIDLDMVMGPRGWEVVASRARAEPIVIRPAPRGRPQPRVRPDPRVVETAESAHAAALDFLRRPLGQLTGPLTSYFALAVPSPAIRLVADAQRGFAKRLLQGTAHEGRPLVTAVAPFRAGGRAGPDSYVDIPAGPLAMRHAAELYLFPNTLCVVEATGAQVQDWLERSACLFRQLAAGSTGQDLIDLDFACYNFDVLDGLTYRFDLSRPPRYTAQGDLIDPSHARVVEMTMGGRPVAPTDRIAIVTDSYRAGGGGMFRAAAEARWICGSAVTARDILVDHIRTQERIAPEARPSWDLVPMPRTRAWFDTGPGALAHVPPRFDPIGTQETGFERFEVAL